ncbi:hypothetical protein UCRPC4_g01303 [Phaeomoniella chlamydospora]|uniref:R3H-associated N-terminal domain-containing protein n=1 Tax=Phaeomoniella chlamydospora TaxID=158046 RepID=A0A0G2GUZ3_PHACM|nr:hypothetical protein UCRPC4_g01303 [Phaeomoniella chlamydospora]
MAIHPIIVNPTSTATALGAERAAHIEAWTEQATEALASISLSAAAPCATQGTSVTLSIPLDDGSHATRFPTEEVSRRFIARAPTTTNNAYGRREPIRRDSLKRREALLKGKEGSRQRRRWENDRLMNNPWAQPPSAADWEIRPTHHNSHVPYHLAPLYDEDRANKRRLEERRRRFHGGKPEDSNPASQVPKEVRAKLKHARAAKGLLQALEEDIRVFVQRWNDKQASRLEDGLHDVDSDEDEIVFVGRNGQMHDSPGRMRMQEDLRRDKLVFEASAEDRSAGFGRWLVHSIATYYGLETWSVTVGNPARREAYVAINDEKSRLTPVAPALPRPLWDV